MAGSKNQLDAFEQRLKDSLEQYEVPYNSADWVQMERALSSGVRSWGRGRALLAGLLVASGAIIGGGAYFLLRDSGNQLAEAAAPAIVLATDGAEAEAAEAATAISLPVQAPASGEHGTADTSTGEGLSGTESSATGSVPAPAQHLPAATRTEAAPTPPAATPPPAPKPAGTIFKASVKEACPGMPVDFTVDHMPEDGIYLWNFGDGSFSNKPNPQHTFSKPGSYQVMLSMSSVGAGTIHNKPSSDMIVIHDAPAAAFNIMKMEYNGQVPSVHFESRAQGAETYHWDFGDGAMSTLPHPDHVYRAKGVYQVVQTVRNATGCVDRKAKTLRIDRDFDMGAPKSFSPNGDGKEDNFMPQALRGLKAKFQLAVYDPAGTLVYSTSDASRPWCGKVKNQGAVCAPGSYVWVADVEAPNRSMETFTGTVELLP